MSRKSRVRALVITEEPRHPDLTPVPRPLIMITAFVSGMAVMVLELMGSRVIGPFYGVSLYVWASLIATALVALSLGYWLGGRLADRKASGAYLYGGILLAAAFICLVPVLRRPVLQLTAPMGVRLGSLASSILLFLPPIACLGIVAPYTVKLHSQSLESLGGSAGSLYAISTVGSVVGTLLTGFFLIPSLPMDAIILGLGVALALMSLTFWILRHRGRGIAASLVVIAMAMGILAGGGSSFAQLQRMGIRILLAKETPYGQLKVMDSGGVRYMLVNGSFQGEANLDTGRSTAPYIHLLAAACREYAPDATRALCIGLGAGSLPNLIQRPGMAVDAVEIDRTVVDAATRFFGYIPAQGTTFVEDGRRYVATADTEYDAILLDAFASEAIPEHLLTAEAFAEYARLLGPRGILGINLVGFTEGPHRRVPLAVVRTMGSVFAHVQIWFIPQESSRAFGSIIIIASASPLPGIDLAESTRQTLRNQASTASVGRFDWEGAPEGILLTDQHNPVAAWNAPVDLAIRQQVLQYMPWPVLMG
ncbi:fused MFS/spermidine synthase [Candidatus Fermentibacteria bacterium]|nr:fused MFS/spermidine synthase [Candidatus Fermentibacteria bacterium]